MKRVDAGSGLLGPHNTLPCVLIIVKGNKGYTSRYPSKEVMSIFRTGPGGLDWT